MKVLAALGGEEQVARCTVNVEQHAVRRTADGTETSFRARGEKPRFSMASINGFAAPSAYLSASTDGTPEYEGISSSRNDLLIRIRRSKRTGEICVEPLGSIHFMIEFPYPPGMAFFDQKPHETRGHVGERPLLPRSLHITILPSALSDSTDPQTHTTRVLKTEEVRRTRNQPRRDKHDTLTPIATEAPMTSASPAVIEYISRSAITQRIVSCCEALFSLRPCWCPNIIRRFARRPDWLDSDLRIAMRAVSYSVTRGAYQRCAFRFGYSPLDDVETGWLYQMVALPKLPKDVKAMLRLLPSRPAPPRHVISDSDSIDLTLLGPPFQIYSSLDEFFFDNLGIGLKFFLVCDYPGLEFRDAVIMNKSSCATWDKGWINPASMNAAHEILLGDARSFLRRFVPMDAVADNSVALRLSGGVQL